MEDKNKCLTGGWKLYLIIQIVIFFFYYIYIRIRKVILALALKTSQVKQYFRGFRQYTVAAKSLGLNHFVNIKLKTPNKSSTCFSKNLSNKVKHKFLVAEYAKVGQLLPNTRNVNIRGVK